MSRFRNSQSGAFVSVSDETASRLGAGWEPADKPKPRKKADPKEPADKPDSD